MEESQLAGDEQKEVSRSWVKKIRIAVAPLVNSQPREILETSALGVAEIDDAVFFKSIRTIKSTGMRYFFF